ncbi:ArnT family glycosyltransferase [Desulfofustis glycolicus]|uniref:4-amino-4-deoxy-L-arabinose transferase n=1 Tax=Desulfofustis glycolicus DSM 9705 TaxID=1121409 RepID=A0A1M5YSZ7_9BACT|nr:phospholipid carrier-dependent glycosyltransferase [Desulfofustis glycolicus]SHI15196.1 4-amino-4-deoxy-L-arabinose transferase [Desulfofustis glycolicus DSM 9705]
MSLHKDSSLPSLPAQTNYITIALFFLLLALIVATIVLGSVPPVDRDALTHHLFVPKLYLQHGGIYEIPEIPFSYYPMNLDLLYMIPLYFGNDIIPKYIHYLFALLTAGLIFNYLKRELSFNYALLGALFFLSIPVIVKLSITVYVDLGVVFFTTASLLLLLSWARTDFRISRLMWAGICCGLAAGTKYNGIVSIVVLTLFVPIIFQRLTSPDKRSNGMALLYCLLFLTIAIITFSPWLTRNALWTGNPIYPLHDALIKRIVSPVTANGIQESAIDKVQKQVKTSNQKRGNHFITRRILYNEQWWQTLLLPFRFFLEGRDDDPRYFDGKLTPFLLFLPFFAILIKLPEKNRQNDRFIFLAFALLYFFFTFFQEALRIRYVAAIVPALVILSMFGLERIDSTIANFKWISETGTGRLSIVITAISIIMLWYNTKYIAEQYTSIQPLPFLNGEISRDNYISLFRPEYPAIKLANSVTSPDTKVLCLFLGNRGYYMDFKPVFDQPYSPSSLLSVFLRSENHDKSVLEMLQARDLSYVLLREDLALSWLHHLDETKRHHIEEFFENDAKPIFKQNGHIFYHLKNRYRGS